MDYWSIMGWLHLLNSSGSMLLLALCISSKDGWSLLMRVTREICCNSWKKFGIWLQSSAVGSLCVGSSGLKWDLKCPSSFSGGQELWTDFRAVSWFVAIWNSFSSSLLMTNWFSFSALFQVFVHFVDILHLSRIFLKISPKFVATNSSFSSTNISMFDHRAMAGIVYWQPYLVAFVLLFA